MRLARKSQLPEFLRPVANSLHCRIIVSGRLRRVGFLLLARLEKPVGAVAIDGFMLGHAG
jgi:hypothetical protein